MTDTPKDKRAAALERIKALASKRSSATTPKTKGSKGTGGDGQTRAPKHGGVGHRPQGG